MRQILLSGLTFILLLLPTDRAWSADEARAIVERAVKALGGEAQLRQGGATHAKVKGTIPQTGGATFSGEAFMQLPGQYKMVLEMALGNMKVSLSQVINGDKAWIKDSFNGTSQEVEAAILNDMKTGLYVSHVASLVPLLKDKSYALSLLGEAPVQGKPALSVKVTSQGHPDVELYFDKASGLLIKTAYRRKDAATGKEVLREETLSDYREVNPAAADEQLLKAAKLGTDDSTLLEFLRKQTQTPAVRSKVRALIDKWTDDSFTVREKASDDLVALGEAAVPQLSKAQKDPDAEIASRAKACLQRIGKMPDSSLPAAVIRLLAQRQPTGAGKILLDYLGSAPDKALEQEIQDALSAVAFREGKADEALVQALQDNDPERRAAAAAALGRDGKTAQDRPGRRLFLRGVKQAMKGIHYQDGEKIMEWELTEVRYFNRFDERVFAKP